MGFKKHNFYYYHSFSFADAISPVIASRVIGDTVPSVNGVEVKKREKEKAPSRSLAAQKFRAVKRKFGPAPRSRVLGLGSIFHHANVDDTIWGSGVNPYWQDRLDELNCSNVRAVRGPLSRKYLMDRYGVEIPEIYGDPALLMPKLFPELQREEPIRKLLILAQYHDEEVIKDFVGDEFSDSVLTCQKVNFMPWESVVREILRSEYVVSTSLHGVIIADAFGVPSRWLHHDSLPSVTTEGRFKYNDYYLSSGREADCFVTSMSDAIARGPIDPISGFDFEALQHAFPRELF